MINLFHKIKSTFLTKEKPTRFENLSSPFYTLVVADGHGTLPRYVENFMEGIGKIDVVFYLGDLELADFRALNGYESIVNAKKFGIVGNHDDFDDLNTQGIEDIHGKLVEYNGVKIVGMMGSFRYKDTKGPMMTDEESEAFAENLPFCDLFITHDRCKHEEVGNTAHKGMSGITKYIEKCSPVCHIHGHIHENCEEIVGNTTSYSFFKLAYIKIDQNGVDIIKTFS